MTPYEPRRLDGPQGQLLECPVWDPARQALWFVDIVAPALCRLDADGTLRKWAMPADIGCFALRAKGGFIVALRDGIYAFNPDRDRLDLIARPDYDPATTRFNDGRCDPQGRFWIGSMYEPRDKTLGGLYCLDTDLTLRRVLDGATVANGLAFTPDGRKMYWADSPSQTVWLYDRDANGMPMNKRVFYRFGPGEGRPDGATLDAQGNYWVAGVDGARLQCIGPDGTLLRSVAMPTRWPTMPCFGGSDMNTLFVTSLKTGRTAEQMALWPHSGSLFAMAADVTGLAEPLFQG